MKKYIKKINYMYIILFILMIIVLYYINYPIYENFCKIPKNGRFGDINDKRVLLDFLPQSNIITSSCDQYWKDWPMEINNDLVDEEPIVLKYDQLDLPKEQLFGVNTYKSGLINFTELSKVLSDEINYDIFAYTSELLIDPLTNNKVKYEYEVNYSIIMLNRKSWINRWFHYNPSVKTTFNYNEIKSPIEIINTLNEEFKKRIDKRQEVVLNNQQLILYGLIPFQIFKYKIINVKYFNKDVNKPVYVIQISLFRESDLYLNTFAYVGFIENGKITITEVKYIGRNSTDSILLAQFYNPKDIHQEIINKNFSNASEVNKDPSAIATQMINHQESFKLKNQYACFDINYSPNDKSNVYLPYYSRESCESSVDTYGRPKSVGIYDTPCKTNEECPFYKINKNYDNDFGKCLSNGKCELPINMIPIGYKYFKNNPENRALCYNCKSDKFQVFTQIDNCCEEQYNKEKYPFLKTPDYVFNNDFQNRQNFFNKKYCYTKPGSLEITCNNIIL
jgi:uncharacterized protein YfcZ (UPF0381/DUF406 family)